MSTIGLFGLVIAFASALVAIVALLVGHIIRRKHHETAETLAWAGNVAVILTFAALTVCCGVLVYCFLVGNYSIQYVLDEHSNVEGPMGVLYDISGLWAGRAGSLLFWAWLISLFNTTVAVRAMRHLDEMDNMAVMVTQIVLTAFIGVLLFSETNMPFTVTSSTYMDQTTGQMTAMAQYVGMSPLLEHWAQAIHPPTLFIGYAGLTIPFAYAIATLIMGDSSRKWVDKATRYAMVSWLFLGIGIGLGCVWAYVVLGWGGYWGWDAVENSSLLSWLVCLALVHSFTVYRKRGMFRRWSIVCACLAFAFAITGTLITRSGIVQSVHAFSTDTVSLGMFIAIIIVAMAACFIGLAKRWKMFKDQGEIESMTSRLSAYYFNNVIMVVFALVLCYLTICSALPSWMPLGGQTVSTGTYNAIARPLGIAYALLVAVAPIQGWVRTDKQTFLKQMRVPAILAGVLFVILVVYWATTLYPAYMNTLSAGDTNAEGLASEGPVWYYNGLAIVGFATASLLIFTALMVMIRGAKRRSQTKHKNPVAAFFGMFAANSSRFGGMLAHMGLGVAIIGLIGSSMFVTEVVEYVNYDEEADTADSLYIDDYELRFTGSSIVEDDSTFQIDYGAEFDVYDVNTGDYIGHVTPTITLYELTQQTKINASVISFPTEDLFVVYKGVSDSGQLSMDVRVNPLIWCVWLGFILIVAGTLIAAFFGHRRKHEAEVEADDKAVDGALEPGGAESAPASDAEKAGDEKIAGDGTAKAGADKKDADEASTKGDDAGGAGKDADADKGADADAEDAADTAGDTDTAADGDADKSAAKESAGVGKKKEK